MRFLVDNQLPPALARLIHNELGSEAMHVSDIGFREATDAEVWSQVLATGSILISKDEDFTSLAMQTTTAGLLWVRIGNCRRAVLLNVFRRVWPRVIERLENGDRFIEIR